MGAVAETERSVDQPRVKVPAMVAKGEPFEVKVLVAHPMESGQRQDETSGAKVPRKILHSFVCSLGGQEILRVTMYPAVSANPYLSFYATAEHSGELVLVWTDDDGSQLRTTAHIEVGP